MAMIKCFSSAQLLLLLFVPPTSVQASLGDHDLKADFQAVFVEYKCGLPTTPQMHACRCEVLRQSIECEVTQTCGIPPEEEVIEGGEDTRDLVLGLRGSGTVPDHDQPRKLSGECIIGPDGKGKAAGSYDCKNVDLIGHLNRAELGVDRLDDIWGWVANDGSGREFAIVDGYDAFIFVEISNPSNPIIVGKLTAQASIWHDAKTFNNHVYMVSEAPGHQLKIFDLTKLLDPNLVAPTTFSPDATYSFSSNGEAHNIVINEDSGYAYVVGSQECNGGLLMLDIHTNPLAPALAGCFGDDDYTHDAQCVIYQGPDTTYQGREICFACNENSVTIVDVTNKNSPTMITRKSTGWGKNEYVHQGWLSEDHRYFFVDEEYSGGRFVTKVLDVTSLSNPPNPAEYENVDPGMEHNQYIRGNMLYQAHYREGLRVLRVDDAATADMTEVGFFDTHPQASGDGYQGMWSNYPFFPSCNIVASDISNGLFVLHGSGIAECADPLVATAAPTTTPPTTSPSESPSQSPSVTPTTTAAPSVSPSSSPSTAPTHFPSGMPSTTPNTSPSREPSSFPSTSPSSSPTKSPTDMPSATPNTSPSRVPSSSPSSRPTGPTSAPVTGIPTMSPTTLPTPTPSLHPTDAPTPEPTPAPSKAPSQAPSTLPSVSPSVHPTDKPTDKPTLEPTKTPTVSPSALPSATPSVRPSPAPVTTPAPVTPAPVTTPAPVAPSPPTGGGGFCFAIDSSTVQVKGKGMVGIMDVELNDLVLSDEKGTFSKVYAFGQRSHNHRSEMIRIQTSCHHAALELTADHMVYLATDDTTSSNLPVTASSVRVGDKLRLVQDSFSLEQSGDCAIVQNVSLVTKQGFVTPITTSGTIVVNGIVASNYAGKHGSGFYHDNIKMTRTTRPALFVVSHYHYISHIAVAPLRFACTWISDSLCREGLHAPETDYDDSTGGVRDGQHVFFGAVHRLKHFVRSDACGPILHAFLLAAVIGFGLIFSILEWVLSGNITIAGFALVFAALAFVAWLTTPGPVGDEKERDNGDKVKTL